MRRLRPGDVVRVTDAVHYSLPAGLHHGDLVKLVRFDHGYWQVERLGQGYLVFPSRIDAGFEYELKGRWVQETDPRVAAIVGLRGNRDEDGCSEFGPLVRSTFVSRR